MADLPSILGGMAQGFLDFGKSAVDLFGTGGAAIGDLVDTIKTGKVSTKNQDDFRKWLYNTDSVQDAAAKGLGTALNGVQTVTDYIPGIGAVTRNPLFNAGQGALGGLADEFKTYGKDYDLGRAGQRAAVSAGAALASGSLGDALKKSANPLLSSGAVQGLARGATGGAISGGGYAAIDGGDIAQSALQGAGTGALIGGATGAIQDFMPRKATYDMALTDDERQARIANAQKQIDDIGPVPMFTDDPDNIAKRARISELRDSIKAYQAGYDTTQDYKDAMAARRANRQPYTPPEAQYQPKIGEDVALGATEVPEGYTRLYRGLETEFDPKYVPQVSDNGYGYESWSDSYDLAREYAGPDGNIYSVDVPNARIADQIVTPDGERMPVVRTDKKAGLKSFSDENKFIDGKEYLLNVNDPLRQELTYSRVTPANTLETTLADADMAVNSPRYLTDENGNPRTFYHGSPNKNITEFDINQAGKNTSSGEHALYFTDSPEVADEFSYERLPSDSMFVDNRGAKGRVYPVNLEMNNPLDLDNLTDAQIRELWQYASPLGQLDGQEKFIKNLTEFRDAAHNGQLTKTLLDLDKLKNSPYDGFTARMYPNQDNQAREYAVFDNSKVKMLEDVLANDDMAVNNPKLTPEQEAYFKDSVIRDENGNLKQLYHGSPNGEFYTFDMKYANPENDWGRGFYFTDNEADVHKNYVGGGPDFDNKVARRAEQIADEQGIDYDAAEQQARKEMYKDDYLINAYTNLTNPATVGKTNLFDGSEYDVKPLADYDNIDDYYNDLIYELTDDVINDTNIDYDAYKNDLMSLMSDAYYNGGIGLQQLKDRINNELWIEDYDGNPVGNDVARSIVQNLGFDGIIDPTVSSKFNNMGIENGTTHYIAFEPNQIKNTNNLKPTDNPDIRYSKAAPDELDLGRVLSGQDLSVNNAKVAPGQLGLFDDMPTQMPKTGTRQTSLFDQPQEGLDYYGSDIETSMPGNGLISRDIEDLTQVPIDVNTLPKGWLKARELADMGKKARQIVLDPNAPNRARNEYNVALYSDAQYGRNMPVADVIDKLGQIQYGREIDRGAARLLADQLDESGDEFAKKFVTGAAEAGGNISHYRDAPKAKLADEQLSSLLNIGRSNSMLSDSLANPSARNARGDQWKGTINLDGKSIAKGSDGGISTFGHERLHAFQDAGNMGYDQRVVDAYNELHDDLSKIYHSDSQIRKDYGSDVKYWSKPIEQEARMAQFYLEDKFGVKGAQRVPERDANGKAIRYKDDGTIADPNNLLDYYTGKPAYKGEFEGDRKAINAAFDKFRGKLQDLTRKGVALPAFLTLFGGGAYMASQENDKEKEVK